MKSYLKENVFDAAIKRINWLFDEFENIIVNFSGGKDSTVLLNLVLRVAEQRGRLPVTVLFIDQEAEWQMVVDYVRTVMNDPRVEPAWLQVPFKIFNATSTIEPWLMCWEPGKDEQWMRQKEPNSYHDNVFGTDRFGELFSGFARWKFGGKKYLGVSGVRCSESPARLQGLTAYETYKGETWGRVENKALQHFAMYPLYDWDDSDIWKAIHSNGWRYCPIYDFQYQHGIPIREMRVSNLHHETAVRTLFYLQEIEGATWEKLTARLQGVNTAKHMRADFLVPKQLPFMFDSWREYRDYLLENLIDNLANREHFRRQFASMDRTYMEEIHDDLHKMHIASVLLNDYHGTKATTFVAAHGRFSKKRGGRAKDVADVAKAIRA